MEPRQGRNMNHKFINFLFLAILVSPVISAKTFELDKDHTNVGFKVRHILTPVQGHFKDFKGSFETDDKGNLVKVDATIEAASIDTNKAQREEHLRSEDFFDVKKYPTLTFVSDNFKIKPGSSGKMPGKLTIHGVTKPVEFEVEFLGEAEGPGGFRKAGATATTKINRKDFALTWNKTLETGGLLVGDEVTILLDVEGSQKTEVPKSAPEKTANKKK
jgi:polyisoprenoid-binding protein YceI